MTGSNTAAIDYQLAHRTSLSSWTRTICTLFFVSGFPALIYQLVWQRALFRIFGVNIESVTVVVTAFMVGLGLGSLAGGWLSRRLTLPLLPLLAIIEILTAVFGLVSLRLFEQVGAFTLGTPLAVTAAVTLALVIVPTLLMGATLPVLVGHLVRRSGNVGSSLGLLYYVNTLGAGAACLVCIIVLFPVLGMQWSIYVAAAINTMVAVGAVVAHLREGGRNQAGALSRQHLASVMNSPIISFPAVLVLACAGGLVSLSYEIFFFRTISYATGSSPAAFAATLGAFLIGLASGSRQGGEFCKIASPDKLVRRVTAHLVMASLLGFLFLPLLGHMAWLNRGVLGMGLLMVYMLARCWGVLLPCLAHLGVAADVRAGMRTALLYLANIAGSASGTIITGFVLMDHLTLVGLAQVLFAGGLSCTALWAMVSSARRLETLPRAGVGLVFAAVALFALPGLTGNVLEALLWKGERDANIPFAHVVENRSGIITVDRSGTVFGNGIYDGHFNIDLVHDSNGVVRPYALSLFHPAPREVLMVGFSSGSWAQVIANNPEVTSLTIIEINPGYQSLAALRPEIASVLTNSKVHFVTDDGRRWLRLNPARRFDAVVSNTTYHFRANASNLLSSEFLGLIKNHLKDGGVLFYNTTSSDRVQRTGCLTFPYGARFTNHMVLSSSPISWDFDRWRHTLEAYRIDGSAVINAAREEDRVALDRLMSLNAVIHADSPATVESPFEPCQHIVKRTAGQDPVTDDNMGTEWRYFWGRE